MEYEWIEILYYFQFKINLSIILILMYIYFIEMYTKAIYEFYSDILIFTTS